MEMTKANRRMVSSLATAKGRRMHSLFVAEGTKCVLETIGSFKVYALLCTAEWHQTHAAEIQAYATCVTLVKRADIIEMSSLTTPSDVMAVYHIPDSVMTVPSASRLSLALDRVQDPGNLGTIVRIASWMGISDIYCSPDSVDLYNPKVVQATMGAIARVRVHYCDLTALLANARRDGVAIYGTFLDGDDIYSTPLTPGGIIVMGNEGSGISDTVARLVDHRLYIPSYPPDAPCVESLNVSVATAIAVAEFRRQTYKTGSNG